MQYADLVRKSRIVPSDGQSGIYIDSVGFFYKPLEMTNGLVFADPTKNSVFDVKVEFTKLCGLYNLFNPQARLGVIRSIESARQIARELYDQHTGEEKRIAEEHREYLRTQLEDFCRLLTDEEVKMLSQE